MIDPEKQAQLDSRRESVLESFEKNQVRDFLI